MEGLTLLSRLSSSTKKVEEPHAQGIRLLQRHKGLGDEALVLRAQLGQSRCLFLRQQGEERLMVVERRLKQLAKKTLCVQSVTEHLPECVLAHSSFVENLTATCANWGEETVPQQLSKSVAASSVVLEHAKVTIAVSLAVSVLESGSEAAKAKRATELLPQLPKSGIPELLRSSLAALKRR